MASAWSSTSMEELKTKNLDHFSPPFSCQKFNFRYRFHIEGKNEA